jgi:hypothetical protein
MDRYCSAELINRKILIPCHPENFLNMEYGVKKWHKPMSNGYKWPNFQSANEWDDATWPGAFKFYKSNGDLSESNTLYTLNLDGRFNFSSKDIISNDD